MKKLFQFARMVRLLYQKFFVVEGPHDNFPVIELGPFAGTGETYSLVHIRPGEYPQHTHHKSDARFYFHSGEGVVIYGPDKVEIPFKAGTVVEAPRGIPHGFRVTREGLFVAWQSIPITNPDTGERDVHYE